jgi:hypothetical protein
MSKTTETLEHMEHAGHAGHGDHGHGHGKPGLSKNIGITMAMLGVLLAICSALVGEARTDFIAKTIEKTNATVRYQTVSTKFRLLQANLQQMNALMPEDPAKFRQLETDFNDAAGKVTGEGVHVAAMLRATHGQTLMTVIPSVADLKRFVASARAYKAETKAAYAYKESYDTVIHGHQHAGHRYEWGMLAAEIGIILASIALLLTSRLAWMCSLALGGGCIAIVVITNLEARSVNHDGEEEIKKARAEYHAVALEDKAEAADEALFRSIEAMSLESRK